jgi:hypothetical protein
MKTHWLRVAQAVKCKIGQPAFMVEFPDSEGRRVVCVVGQGMMSGDPAIRITHKSEPRYDGTVMVWPPSEDKPVGHTHVEVKADQLFVGEA